VRLLSCSKEQLANYTHLDDLGDQLETHVQGNPLELLQLPTVRNLHYPPLNKPRGIVSWLTMGRGRELPGETPVLIVDPDMLFRPGTAAGVLLPLVERVRSGEAKAIGFDYFYTVKGMNRTNWWLPKRFNLGGSISQLQSIGPPILLQRDVLAGLAPKWHDITLEIAQKREYRDHVYNAEGPQKWIAEMYGYTLAAAGLRHETQSRWPHFRQSQPPFGSTARRGEHLVLHYTHSFWLCGRRWGKQLFRRGSMSNMLNCSFDLRRWRPPSFAEVASPSCRLEAARGAKALPHIKHGKAISLEAWSAIHASLRKWHEEHCRP